MAKKLVTILTCDVCGKEQEREETTNPHSTYDTRYGPRKLYKSSVTSQEGIGIIFTSYSTKGEEVTPDVCDPCLISLLELFAADGFKMDEK